MPTAYARRFLALATVVTAVVALPLQAQAYSGVYIFGDSLSDSGNNSLALTGGLSGVPQVVTDDSYVPSFPYAPSGTYSNGPVWATSFAAALGTSALPSLMGGSNYAFGGAETSVDGPIYGFPPSLSTQVGMALLAGGGSLSSSALYVVEGGGNNARHALEALGPAPSWLDIVTAVSAVSAAYAIDVGNIVDTLQAAGAQHIVVWNTPNLGLAPAVTMQGPVASHIASLMTMSMNSALDYRLSFETGVTTFDLFGLVGQIVAAPGAYGLTNASNACGAAVNACDPATALFWDGIHPTAAGHAILSGAMVAAVVPEPGSVWLLMAGLVGVAGLLRRRSA